MAPLYLCIYNASLAGDSESEEALKQQIVFYFAADPEEESVSVQLNRVGLAQGIINFGKSFSDGMAVSVVDTSDSRFVYLELEKGWWIVAAVADEHPQVAGEILRAQLRKAHFRWALHHGTLEWNLATKDRAALLKSLDSWWRAFANSWYPSLGGDGVNFTLPGTRMSNLKPNKESIEAADAFLESGRHSDIVEMFVIRPDAQGCVYSSSRSELSESIVDWILDCDACNDSTAYLNDVGFVYHMMPLTETALSSSIRDMLDVSNTEPVSTPPIPEPGRARETITENNTTKASSVKDTMTKPGASGLGDAQDGESIENGISEETPRHDTEIASGNQDESSEQLASSGLTNDPIPVDEYGTEEEAATLGAFSMMGGLMVPSMASLGVPSLSVPSLSLPSVDVSKLKLAGENIGDAFTDAFSVAKDSANQLAHLMTSLPKLPFANSKKLAPSEKASADDIIDSRFLVGLMGNLEDAVNDEPDEQSPAAQRTVTTKYVYGPDNKQYNVVVYCRRPFIFAILVKKDSVLLQNASFYTKLHLKLASLVEPMYHGEAQGLDHFYHILVDEGSRTWQSTIPPIPKLTKEMLERQEPKLANKLLVARNELEGLHSCALALLQAGERRKQLSMQTSRNWWVYYSTLPNKKVVFAKRGQSKEGILGGWKDAKVWLAQLAEVQEL